MTENIVYLNGEFIPQSQAKVSIMDRGFLFADGVYEVVPVVDQCMFGVDEHLDRLQRSLDGIALQPPHSSEELKQIFTELLSRNSHLQGDLNVYLQITRGNEETRNHAIPEQVKPTVLAFCTPKTQAQTLDCKGFKAITHQDTRRPDCFIKAIALLPNILIYQKAQQAGALEAILLRDGYVMECTSSNVFMVKDDIIKTPPISSNILGGITRHLILTIARQNNLATAETLITEAELREADEIWVTGSSKDICPIVQLDDQAVGNGQVGPLWKKVHTLYRDYRIKTQNHG